MKKIKAKFYGREEWINYTTAVLRLLQTDPSVECIIDAETGEIID